MTFAYVYSSFYKDTDIHVYYNGKSSKSKAFFTFLLMANTTKNACRFC